MHAWETFLAEQGRITRSLFGSVMLNGMDSNSTGRMNITRNYARETAQKNRLGTPESGGPSLHTCRSISMHEHRRRLVNEFAMYFFNLNIVIWLVVDIILSGTYIEGTTWDGVHDCWIILLHSQTLWQRIYPLGWQEITTNICKQLAVLNLYW